MLGSLFVHLHQFAPGKTNLRTGVVKKQLGEGHWVLAFKSADYEFSNVVSSAGLEKGYVFFDTEDERTKFINDLTQEMAAKEKAAGVPFTQ